MGETQSPQYSKLTINIIGSPKSGHCIQHHNRDGTLQPVSSHAEHKPLDVNQIVCAPPNSTNDDKSPELDEKKREREGDTNDSSIAASFAVLQIVDTNAK